MSDALSNYCTSTGYALNCNKIPKLKLITKAFFPLQPPFVVFHTQEASRVSGLTHNPLVDCTGRIATTLAIAIADPRPHSPKYSSTANSSHFILFRSNSAHTSYFYACLAITLCIIIAINISSTWELSILDAV
jgi:hypothetical protein